MIIDAHIHVGGWTHADFLGLANDVEGTLAMMRASGIDGAALMPSDRYENAGLLEAMKRAIAAGAAPGPLWFFPWIRPCDEAGVGQADLEWVRAHRSDIAGLKIHPSLSRVRVTDERFRPALELADELSLVVLVHCGRWTEIAGYQHAIDVAVRYPRVKFLFAHAGGDTPPNATGAARAVHDRGLENVWLEFSGLREYWVVERNVALIGAERYLMGSDFPLAHPRMYLAAIDAMSTLTEAQRDLIRGGNALKLFGAPLGV
jgi:predicted TIM-barrel fold metal-dependent hydrolase